MLVTVRQSNGAEFSMNCEAIVSVNRVPWEQVVAGTALPTAEDFQALTHRVTILEKFVAGLEFEEVVEEEHTDEGSSESTEG
jgi:hypothetical protein